MNDLREAKDRRPERPPLGREFVELLINASNAVRRYGIYPEGHPALRGSIDAVAEPLAELLRDRDHVRIGVARETFLAEGGTSDPRNRILSALAGRLHQLQIAGVSLTQGVTREELNEFLNLLGRAQDTEEEPLGVRELKDLPTWPHIRIHPIGVDGLVLGAEGRWDGSQADDLWTYLATTLLGRVTLDPDVIADTEQLARTMEAQIDDPAHQSEVTDQLVALMADLRAASGTEADEVRRQVSSLLNALSPDALDRLLEMGGDAELRRRFLHDVNRALPPEGMFAVLAAAARTAGREMSPVMQGLLTKISDHGSDREGESGEAEWAPGGDDVGEAVDRLLDDWIMEDRDPGRSSGMLDSVAWSLSPTSAGSETEEDSGPEDVQQEAAVPGALRTVRTALDVGACGATVKRALLELVDAGEIGPVLELLDEEAGRRTAARSMLDYLTAAPRLRRILGRPEVEERALDALVTRVGDDAIEPLMEMLVESDSRSLRRKLFDTLARLGPRVGELAVEGLDDPRWFVQRNMLALLHELESLPKTFDPFWFTSHGDHRVRREAFPLALRDPVSHDQVLSLAISDRDKQLVRLALLELRDGVPKALIPTVVHRAMNADQSDDIRVLAVRIVRDIDSPLVRDALLAMAAPGRSFFGRPQLGPSSPPTIAALEVLSASWSHDASVRRVLKRARRSRDPEIVRAAGGTP